MNNNISSYEDTMKMVPDWHRRLIEAEARKCADDGLPVKKWEKHTGTYAEALTKEMEYIIWVTAYKKRMDRLERMSGRS